MGQDNTGIAATVTNIQVTPTRTIFVLHAGPMNVTVNFLTPIEVRDSAFRMAWLLSQHFGAPPAQRLGQAVHAVLLRICGGGVP